MTLRRIGFLALVVAAAGSAFAQENAQGPSSVETAMKEIQGLLETATADLKDYHQISLERAFLSPIPNSANGDRVTTETLKQRFDYYRGEGDTYRVEISAGRKSLDGADPSADAITIDPAIRYRDSDGAEFLRIFHRRLMTNGDAAELVVWRPQSPRVGITSAFVHNDFNPRFVYNKSGIQWTDLFRGILPACDTVTRRLRLQPQRARQFGISAQTRAADHGQAGCHPGVPIHTLNVPEYKSMSSGSRYAHG